VHRQLAEAYDALGRDADRQRQLELYERQKAERLQRGVFR
jgi:CRISPR/Cas system-associated endoribonuclease Cas2